MKNNELKLKHKMLKKLRRNLRKNKNFVK